MSSSLELLDNSSTSIRSAISVLFAHMDAVIVILCSFGICLSSLPNLSFSKVSADTKDAQPFFQGSMKAVDYFNGSVDELAQSLRTVSMCGAFFYAKWDSASMEARDTVELLHYFSPFKLIAVDCWIPTASCRTKMKLKRFPQLKLYAQNAGSFAVDDLRSVSHIADRLAFLMKPLVFVRSEEDLVRLTLSHTFIVLGYFNFGRSDSKDFLHYHQASLSVCNLLPHHFICGRELIFAVAPNTLHLSLGRTVPVQFYLRCNSSTVTYDYQEAHLKSEVLVDNIVHRIRKLPTHCLFSTDLTPDSRSAQLDTVFSNGPVLLLIGPHTSIAKGMDPPLYLLRSLESSYKSCPPKNASLFQTTLFNSDWKDVSFTRHYEPLVIMRQMALSAYYKRCQQASVCPRWLQYLSPLVKLEPKDVCGVPAHGSVLFNSNDTQEVRDTKQSILPKILEMLNNSYRSDLLTLAISLIHDLSLDRDSPLPVHHTDIDATAMVERLHFICCSWYHRHRHAEHDILSSPGCASDVAPLAEPPTLPASSVVNGLACGVNKTLSFHTLDSLKYSELVWSLTGFDAELRPSNFGAAIIDKPAEAVYRLEEPVSYESLSRFVADYHASKLIPWRRHPLPSDEHRNQPSFDANGSRILEIRNASQLEHLLDVRSHIRTGTAYIPNTFQIRSGLVLLYYTRACGYASHGDSLLWHFTRVAESFSNEQTVVFAKVDVSQVDLPWHLRVERVPTVMFFPANRSTYSTRFHWPTVLPTDPSFELINFVRSQLGSQLLVRPTSSVQLSSVRARTQLWQSLQNAHNKLNSDSFVVLRNSCSHRRSPSKSLTCLKEILTSLRGYIDKYVQAIKLASSLIAHLEKTLEQINTRLTCPLTRLYWSAHSPQQLHRSLQVLAKQSNMWHNALGQKKNLSNTLTHLVSHAESINVLL